MISPCCKAKIAVGGRPGIGDTRWYYCPVCNNSCDPMIAGENQDVRLSESDLRDLSICEIDSGIIDG